MIVAYQALFVEGDFKSGQNALIHAVRCSRRVATKADDQGASGVGIAAIQLAREICVSMESRSQLTSEHVGGADKVFTTCGTDEKVKFLQKLGLEEKLHVINYRTQSQS